jgi:hypothetical protein
MQFPIKLKGYAIFNPATGLFSRGKTGRNFSWGKRPKIWGGLNYLKNHLCQYVHRGDKCFNISDQYAGCHVIDVTTGEIAEDINIYKYLRDYANRQIEKYYRKDYEIRDMRGWNNENKQC